MPNLSRMWARVRSRLEEIEDIGKCECPICDCKHKTSRVICISCTYGWHRKFKWSSADVKPAAAQTVAEGGE